MNKPFDKIKLHGFNNLTKSLSFSIYDICYAKTEQQRKEYLEYIDEQYSADRLTDILKDVTDIIGANVLNIARQDYEPQGASVTILVSEEPVEQQTFDSNEAPGPLPDSVVAHLDKSTFVCILILKHTLMMAFVRSEQILKYQRAVLFHHLKH